MIVIDVNLLIYAYNEAEPKFLPARKWLQDVLSGSEPVGLPWAVIHAFLRLTTAARIMPAPLNASEATAVVDQWMSSRAVQVIEPGSRYWLILRDLLIRANVRGSLVSDTHLAAIALERDATLCTVDRNFRRFPGLRILNPLA